MEAGDWATWIGSAAAIIAAASSVAVWWRDRSSVAWDLRGEKGKIPYVINVGSADAHQVRIRAGSASDPADVDAEAHADVVAPGEVIRILALPDMESPEDYAVIVTWRTRFGRSQTWTRLIV
ncbi:hypothetical protein [Streptomyces glaucosporus]